MPRVAITGYRSGEARFEKAAVKHPDDVLFDVYEVCSERSNCLNGHKNCQIVFELILEPLTNDFAAGAAVTEWLTKSKIRSGTSLSVKPGLE